MTKSASWQEAGAEDKAAAVVEMRAAKEQGDDGLRQTFAERDPAMLQTEGARQGALGRVVGCEGMVQRGGDKVRAGRQLEGEAKAGAAGRHE